MLVALTGSTGFIGKHLLRELPGRGFRLRALLRRPSALSDGIANAIIGDLQNPLNMSSALSDVDAVIHSAGATGSVSGLPEEDYRSQNIDATQSLAEAAQRAGVKRFVFLSSVRAQCGATADSIITERLESLPTDAYGRSKLAAEQALRQINMDWVALRLATVVGSGAKGNVDRIVRIAASPYPLPFGGLTAKRSFLSIDNLVSAIETVLTVPGKLGRPFLVADREPLSLAEAIAAIREGMGRSPRLFSLPSSLLATAFAAFGKQDMFQVAARPLVIDAAELRTLGWTESVSSHEGLRALGRFCARQFTA